MAELIETSFDLPRCSTWVGRRPRIIQFAADLRGRDGGSARRSCGHVTREHLSLLSDNPSYTKRFAYYVGRRCRQATVKDIADELVVARGRHNTCYLEQLDPPADGIWEIRSRDPKPSLRLLGAFAERDVLVGTHLLERSNLGGPDSRQWKDVIRACKAEWRKLFLTYPRHQGETLSDYLCENAIDETAFD